MIRAVRLPEEPAIAPQTDSDVVSAYLEDASGTGPGWTSGLLRPESTVAAASMLRRAHAEGTPVLFQAARSSLTAGSVPRGETVVSVERLNRIDAPRARSGAARVRVESGVRLDDLTRRLAEHGLYYPPVPTFQQAMVGGTLATNAGGAASFKYGVTRGWVHGLEVLLYNGDLIRFERGEVVARRGECFAIALADGTTLRVPTPTYRLPAIKKLSAGYHAADSLDLVDLFVGSEGTLGLITAATLDLVPLPPALVSGLVLVDSTGAALDLAADLRRAGCRARGQGDRRDPDVRSIESIDRGGLDLLRGAAAPARWRVPLPPATAVAILFEVELTEPIDGDTARDRLAAHVGPDASDGPLQRLARILDAHDALDRVQLALPGDASRREALSAFREAVPARVNEVLAERRRVDPAVCKVGGDLIVPFDRLAEMIDVYEEGFRRRGLDFAIWGHLSDGNLHPNALPRSAAEVRQAADALLEFCDEAVRRGGAPLSEHGVGRSALKQELLRRFLGAEAIASMREVKQALDPGGRLAPGVLLPR